MTAFAPFSTTDTAGRITKFARFAATLLRCPKAATISEYGLGAMLLVTAASAAHSPRLHSVKDGSCDTPAAGCFHERAASSVQTVIKAKPPAARTATKAGRLAKPAETAQPNS